MKKLFILLAIASFFITYASTFSFSLDSVWSKNINAVVQQTLFSHDGQSIYVASIESNHQLLILDAATGDSIGEFKGIFNPKNIALTTDGETLYAICDSLFMGWDTHSGSVVKTIHAPRDTNYDSNVIPMYDLLAVSGDGRLMATIVLNKLFSETVNYYLTIWDLINDTIIKRINFPQNVYSTKLKFSNNGNYLACGERGENLQPGGDIILYNTNDWSVYSQFHGHSIDIRDLDFSPNDSLLASTANESDSTIILWDVKMKKISHVIRYAHGSLTYIYDGSGSSVKFLNNFILISGGMNELNRQLICWNLFNYDTLFHYSDGVYGPVNITNYDLNLSLSNDKHGILFLNIDTTSTSINELIEHKTEYQLYPNPSNETLNIRINNNNINKTKIDIIDNTGRIVKSIRGETQTINTSDLPAGSYFLRTQSGKQNVTYKLIISR